MKISAHFIARITGMILLAYIGSAVGKALSSPPFDDQEITATQLLMLSGAGLGLLTTHRWTVLPFQRLLQFLRGASLSSITTLTMGMLLGALIAALIAIPLSYLPAPFGQFLPVAGLLVGCYISVYTMMNRRRELEQQFRSLQRLSFRNEAEPQHPSVRRFVVDTSAIIDGRIAVVSQTGFIDGTLVVPSFVLAELQTLADSADELRRNKGRRGLELLNTMQKDGPVPVEILEQSADSSHSVDERLIQLARQYHCPIITNDYNLGRVAELQGIVVLNMNQLADAVRPPVMPGQELTITVRDTGREREQGIAFLDDGTMIVVEDARSLVGQQVLAVVTRIYQTQTGRIVFAQLSKVAAQVG